MPWLRAGDNAATHPIVMRVLAHIRSTTETVSERDVALNEVFGFVMRCALQSAGHTTDYLVEEGTAFMVGGARTDRLIELARKAGYLKQVRHQGVRAWQLIDDPDFIHIRLRAEIEWERQQRADSANPALTAPVRLRDGDQCRYCGFIVNWRARKGKLQGTYDHREPGKAATVETLVVACGECNAGRRDHPDADDRRPLRPAPATPFYSRLSADFLANHGHAVIATEDLRPGSQPDTAHSDPATSRTPRTAATAGSADSADPLPTKSGFAGSGRVGSGARSSQPQRNSRRRRSARGRPRTGEQR